MLATEFNSTILAASNLNDHFANPFGGSLQQRVINFASTSPSVFDSYIREVSRLSRLASKPSSMNFFLTLSTVRIPTLSTLLICSLVTFSEYLPSSQFKRMYACLLYTSPS